MTSASLKALIRLVAYATLSLQAVTGLAAEPLRLALPSERSAENPPDDVPTQSAPATDRARLLARSTSELLYGVNLAGLGFGDNAFPGKVSVNYVVPSSKDVAYFATKGMRLVRFDFRWERLQPKLGGPLNPEYLGYIRGLTEAITSRGLIAILDLHNYARRKTVTPRKVVVDLLGTPSLPDEAFADVWRRLAEEFKSNPLVWFGLMNEPHEMPTRQWLRSANAAAKAIRETGATNKILVMGNHWGGAKDFVSTDNAVVMAGFKDPGNNFAFEVHQYLDAPPTSFGGPAIAGSGATVLSPVTRWARSKGFRLFLGEFAFLGTPHDMAEGKAMLEFIEANSDVWLGWAWWAAGPWWGDYYYSLQPSNGQDKPQMDVLQHFIARAREQTRSQP